MKQRAVVICMLALLLVTAFASTGMSTDTENQSQETHAKRRMPWFIPLNWRSEIYDVGPLPGYSSEIRAGYMCSRFGILWANLAIWNCNPVAYSDDAYDPDPRFAQWISRNYSMDDAKRGFWDQHGRWVLLLIGGALVVGSVRRSSKATQPQIIVPPTFRKLKEMHLEDRWSVMERYGSARHAFTGVVTHLSEWYEGGARLITLLETGEDIPVVIQLSLFEDMGKSGEAPRLDLDRGIFVDQTIRVTGRIFEFPGGGESPSPLFFGPDEPVEALGADGRFVPVIAPTHSSPQSSGNLPLNSVSETGMNWRSAVKVLNRHKGAKYNLGALLRDCKPEAISLISNILVCRFASRANFQRTQEEMTNSTSRSLVVEAVGTVFGSAHGIRFTSPVEADGVINVSLVRDTSSTLAGLASPSTKLHSIGISTRALNCLERAGITDVQEVIEMSDEVLLGIKNFGPVALAELRDKVSRLQVDSND